MKTVIQRNSFLAGLLKVKLYQLTFGGRLALSGIMHFSDITSIDVQYVSVGVIYRTFFRVTEFWHEKHFRGKQKRHASSGIGNRSWYWWVVGWLFCFVIRAAELWWNCLMLTWVRLYVWWKQGSQGTRLPGVLVVVGKRRRSWGGGGRAVAPPPNENIGGGGQTYRFAPPPPNNFANLKNS